MGSAWHPWGHLAGQVWFNLGDQGFALPEASDLPLATGRHSVVFEQRDLAVTPVGEAHRARQCPSTF